MTMQTPRNAVAITALLPCIAMAAGLADQVSNAGGGGTFDRPVSGLNGAQVVAAKGASSASVKVSRKSSFSDPGTGDTPGVGYFSVWSLTGNAPLNKSGDDTDLANLDGLTNAASLELKYSSFRVPGRRNPNMNAVVPKLDAICQRVSDAAKDPKGVSPVPTSGCDYNDVVQYGSSSDQHDYKSAFWDVTGTNRWIWGGSAKLGYQNFEFVEAASATKGKQHETPWSAGAFVAYNPDALRALFTLGLQYQHAFKEGTNGTVCPASMGAPVTCVTSAVGKPKETNKKLVSLEARKDFGVAGAGLTVNRDFEGKVWGLEVPVSFIKDKDGNFIGGVKAGWRSDNHVFTAGVFVGTAFGLFK